MVTSKLQTEAGAIHGYGKDQEPALSPAEALARLKTIVKHLEDLWPALLHRQTYFHALTRSAELAEALTNTYAAHTHNTISDMFVIDLIREIGALVLDRDSRSASVAIVVQILDNPFVLDELRKDYRIVLPSHWLGGRDVSVNDRRAIDEELNETQILENLAEFDARRSKLPEIHDSVLNSNVGSALVIARNKSVAHYDIVRDGNDWKMWRIEGTGLTYGQLDEYVDACTSAVDTLLHFVGRTAFDFNGTREVARDYANDYIDALVIGLRRKKELNEERVNSQLDELGYPSVGK
jgi:hypothetical protein